MTDTTTNNSDQVDEGSMNHPQPEPGRLLRPTDPWVAQDIQARAKIENWPRGWDQDRTLPAGGQNRWHVPTDLRPYYRRSERIDSDNRARYLPTGESRFLGAGVSEWEMRMTGGLPVGVDPERGDPDHVRHVLACYVAWREFDTARDREAAARRVTAQTCSVCHITDSTVHTGGLDLTDPLGSDRLCNKCRDTAHRELDHRTDTEPVNDHQTRAEAVRAYLDRKG